MVVERLLQAWLPNLMVFMFERAVAFASLVLWLGVVPLDSFIVRQGPGNRQIGGEIPSPPVVAHVLAAPPLLGARLRQAKGSVLPAVTGYRRYRAFTGNDSVQCTCLCFSL